MRDKKVYVPIVKLHLISEKWKLIISLLGVKVGKQHQKIVRCFVGIAIEQSQENKKQ